jgi:hypothetical protein
VLQLLLLLLSHPREGTIRLLLLRLRLALTAMLSLLVRYVAYGLAVDRCLLDCLARDLNSTCDVSICLCSYSSTHSWKIVAMSMLIVEL